MDLIITGTVQMTTKSRERLMKMELTLLISTFILIKRDHKVQDYLMFLNIVRTNALLIQSVESSETHSSRETTPLCCDQLLK